MGGGTDHRAPLRFALRWGPGVADAQGNPGPPTIEVTPALPLGRRAAPQPHAEVHRVTLSFTSCVFRARTCGSVRLVYERSGT